MCFLNRLSFIFVLSVVTSVSLVDALKKRDSRDLKSVPKDKYSSKSKKSGKSIAEPPTDFPALNSSSMKSGKVLKFDEKEEMKEGKKQKKQKNGKKGKAGKADPPPVPTQAPTEPPTIPPTPNPTAQCSIESGINCTAVLDNEEIACEDIPPEAQPACDCADCVREVQFRYTGKACSRSLSESGKCSDSGEFSFLAAYRITKLGDVTDMLASGRSQRGDVITVGAPGGGCLPGGMAVAISLVVDRN